MTTPLVRIVDDDADARSFFFVFSEHDGSGNQRV